MTLAFVQGGSGVWEQQVPFKQFFVSGLKFLERWDTREEGNFCHVNPTFQIRKGASMPPVFQFSVPECTELPPYLGG